MRFDLVDLRVFLAVAQRGSFKQAAVECAVTLPAVSLRMKKLEEAFETALFERRSRGVTLTAAGLRLRDEALKVMLSATDLEEVMAPFAARRQNILRLHASMCPMDSHLPDYVAPFMKAHPEIHFEFVTEHTDIVIRSVASGRADLGAVSFPIDYYGVQYLPMDRDEFVLATPADSDAALPAGCTDSVTQRDVAKLKIFALGPNVLVQSHIERLFEKAGLRLDIAARLPTLSAALHVAGVTGGWVVTFRKGLRAYQETLRIVPISEPWAKLATQIVLPADEKRLTKNAAEFIRFFRERTAAQKETGHEA